uniref:Calmodulin binding transcription activator 1 n=1 Tax=Pyxicephalus adspersus TaxID=30357 RepID=A0AAV2ZUY9_PYXAD|nr:TPA: hypothetical protein GDO54_003849 [Pyxicephalus adspersus]
MWRAEGKWLPRTSRKTTTTNVLIMSMNNLVEGPLSSRRQTAGKYDDHGNSNGSHVKIFLPKKLLECLPKCSSLPKERHRWNTNESSCS